MMTVDEMLSEVARLVDKAPKQGGETERSSAPAEKRAAEKKPIPDAVINNERTAAADTVPSAPAHPSHAAGGSVRLKPALRLHIAKEIAYCVEKAAAMMGVNVVTAIVDEGGNLILLEAMDDSYIASVTAAREKAYTAVALKMPTHEALKESRGGTLDGFTNGNGILMLGGGYQIEYAGRIAGGIGVSGGTKEQDMLLARIGTEYFKKRINSL